MLLKIRRSRCLGHATIKYILRGINFKNPCQCRNTDLIVKLAEVLFIIEFDNKYVSAIGTMYFTQRTYSV